MIDVGDFVLKIEGVMPHTRDVIYLVVEKYDCASTLCLRSCSRYLYDLYTPEFSYSFGVCDLRLQLIRKGEPL